MTNRDSARIKCLPTSCFTLSLPETSGILRTSLSVTDDPVLIMREDAVDGLGRHSPKASRGPNENTT